MKTAEEFTDKYNYIDERTGASGNYSDETIHQMMIDYAIYYHEEKMIENGNNNQGIPNEIYLRAKHLHANDRKLDALKLLRPYYPGLKDAKDYIDNNF